MQIEKKEYNVLSLGAGVQSSTLALMAENNEIIIDGINYKPDFAIFADTQSEPKYIYEWLDYLKSKIKSFPIYTTTQGSLEEYNISVKNNSLRLVVPFFTKLNNSNDRRGVLQRRCTRDFKIRPINRFLREKLQIRKNRDIRFTLIDPTLPRIKGNVLTHIDYNVTVKQWIGISTDEASRMRDSVDAWLTNFYPLIQMEMTRQDCIVWMKKKGYDTPPRSACYFCPYHSDDEWLNLKINHPAEFQRAVDYEKTIEKKLINIDDMTHGVYFHQSCKPLNEIEFIKGNNKKAFNNECEGMCGN